MAYSPTTNASGPMQAIRKMVEDCVKEIRHMDRIDYDPEAQRIKALVFDACRKSFLLGFPDETVTTHVTTSPEAVQVSTGTPGPSVTVRLDEVATMKCETCKSLHDPRKTYDHTPMVGRT